MRTFMCLISLLPCIMRITIKLFKPIKFLNNQKIHENVHNTRKNTIRTSTDFV